jgi:hypothetical protein
MYQFWANYRHPFRLFAFFSVFSLFALRTGELVYLWNLLFLLFLLPAPAKWSEGRMAGFLPFVNEGGQRVVRWHRLVLVWLSIFTATTFGSCLAAHVLAGDWYGAFPGVATGAAFSAMATVQGFTRAVEDLPSIN